MQTLSNRWLVGIAVVVAALVLVSVVLAVTNRRGASEAFPESEPEGVVQRYILAIQDRDYSLAHGYLSDELKESCTVDHIRKTARGFMDRSKNRRIALVEKDTLSDGRTEVRVRVTEFRVSPPFDMSEYSHEERYVLVQEGGEWRLDEPPWPIGWCRGPEEGPSKPRPLPAPGD